MSAYSILSLRLLAYLLMFVLTFMYTTIAISQEDLKIGFEDIETRILFFAKIESSRRSQNDEQLTVFSQIEQSIKPFRQHLIKKIDKKQVSKVNPIWGGIMGATVGFFGGGFLAAELGCNNCGFEPLYRFFLGATIGETLLIPVGVHHGNRRQGNFGLVLLTSVAVAGAGLFIIDRSNADASWLLLVPVLQIGTTVAVERAASQHR